MKKEQILIGVIIYTCVIQACIRANCIEKDIQVFEALKASPNAFPDQVIYNTIINGCIFAGRLSNACTYLNESIKANVALAEDRNNNNLRNILTSKKMPYSAKTQQINQIVRFANEHRILLGEGIITRLRIKYSYCKLLHNSLIILKCC